MTTWTPVPQQTESWTSGEISIGVFSQFVFSHAFFEGKRVFSLGKSGGVWDLQTSAQETWTPE